jgi:hypothetical protein
MILDFADAQTRARTVGLCYLVRSLSITPASAIGGLLWRIRPQIPFFAGGVIGIVGTLLFAATVEERNAGWQEGGRGHVRNERFNNFQGF